MKGTYARLLLATPDLGPLRRHLGPVLVRVPSLRSRPGRESGGFVRAPRVDDMADRRERFIEFGR